MNPYALLVAAIAFAGIVAGASWKAYELGQASVIANQAMEEQIRQQTREDAAKGAAEAIAKQEPKNVTIRQTVEREIVERPVYRDCLADDGMFNMVNQAITGGEPAGNRQLP